jgi:uncharacterized protein
MGAGIFPCTQRLREAPFRALLPGTFEARELKGGEAMNKDEPRGFATMAPARQREVASKGGRVAHERGLAHEFTSEEGRIAGRKGGELVSRDRAHMAEIGRRGGLARRRRRRVSNKP